MSRTEADYEPLVSLIEQDGGEYWLEDRGTTVVGDDGPVLVEVLTESLRLEWVSLPEHEWFRAMAKDERKTIGIPMQDVHRITSGNQSPLRVLRGNITRRGLDEGWTCLGANSPNDLEAQHHGFKSLEQFRTAARVDAFALSDALTDLFTRCAAGER